MHKIIVPDGEYLRSGTGRLKSCLTWQPHSGSDCMCSLYYPPFADDPEPERLACVLALFSIRV